MRIDESLIDGVPDLMTIGELSKVTGMSPYYLRKLAREGAIPAYKIGSREWRVSRRQLIEQLEGRCAEENGSRE